ncbi:MAG: DHA2 family efflux MFS transporter permease subunit [Rhodospirillales bacterium]|jgi:DHA2 family multidrug resistance protein|nr:DHA2 family efflux MFS transporter permease subunit [Rhodospirillales bacterium]MDP6773062.1 DHA2 family efflux MFS transporter permease subunit [Rhodospirillales bacterium]
MTGTSKAVIETAHRGLLIASVVLASLVYAIDWTIAAVALPHMQGTFSATQDQVSWALTLYIATGAIMMPTAGWLSSRFGRKRLFVLSIGGFTVFSIFCGAADSLTAEVLYRVGQGATGAFLIPLSQSIMLDIYPRHQHTRAMAIWGMWIMLGPIIGPSIGGYLTEIYSWRWIFYLNAPVGILALAGTVVFLPKTASDLPRRPFDWIGFIAIACALGAFQLMLDRGQRLDWFDSSEIMIEAAVCAAGLYVFVAHGLMARAPLVNIRLMRDLNYALGLAIGFLYGVLTLAPIVLMPTFLEDLKGFPMLDVGLLLTPRGAGLMIAMLAIGRLGGRIDHRLLLASGFLLFTVSSWAMSGWNLQVGVWQIVWTGLVQGLGAGMVTVPMNVLTFATLDPKYRTEAASMFNLIRSAGSSIGIAVAVTVVTRMANVNRSTLVEHVSPFNELLLAPPGSGGWGLAGLFDLARLELEIDRQALMVGYIDVFHGFSLAALLAIPVVLFLGKSRTAEH